MAGNMMASMGQVASKVGNAMKGPVQQHGRRADQYIQQAPSLHKSGRVAGEPTAVAAASTTDGGGEAMPEWKLNCLCNEYGLPTTVRGHLPMGGCF